MQHGPDILCIGSVLWDVVGRAAQPLGERPDVPGRIRRLPGGVALNIAMVARGFGLRPVLISAVGCDAAGDELVAACSAMGLDTGHLLRDPELPTDVYMAIEDGGRLVAAIADAHSLEAAGARILAPLIDGALASPAAPYPGLIALDGNLTEALMAEIAAHPAFGAADLRIAPASPGKAERLAPLMSHAGATLYVNLQEAGFLTGARFDDAATAATALTSAGAHRVLVTDGDRPAALGQAGRLLTAAPPAVRRAERITGAGDTFMAAHIAAEARGLDDLAALEAALSAAARYVSGSPPA